MAKFEVYQIDAHAHPDEAGNAMLSGMVEGADLPTYWKAGLFAKVATVEADDLEHVFTIMNRWSATDEASVTRLARLHSLSVGDVVIDVDGNAHVVAPLGFTPLPIDPATNALLAGDDDPACQCVEPGCPICDVDGELTQDESSARIPL